MNVAPYVNRNFVYEQHVIGCANVGLIFANGDSRSGIEIDGFLALDEPTAGVEHLVNFVASNLFRILVRRHATPFCASGAACEQIRHFMAHWRVRVSLAI